MSKKSVSKYGFRRDSPYKNKGKLVIQSNVIDMNDTDFPLLLVPDNDEPVVAPAQSGGYFFPNSNSVTEYRLDKLPKFNKGGKTKKTRRSLRAEPEPVYGSYQKENRSAKRIARDYSLSDFIISPEDLQEMTEAELNCNTGNCLGSASQYFNFYVAPKLGLDDTWTQKAHAPSGPNNPRFADYGASVDSWDIHRVLTEDGGLPVFRGTGYMDYMMEPIPEDKRISISTIFPREQDREDFFKSLPVGTVVGYKYGYAAGGDSYDVKSGETIKDSRHSAIVIGYTPDGKPILFDNTKRKVIDQTMYDMDDITNITVPRTAADSNFNYFKVTGELTPTKFDYTQDSRNKVLFGIPDRLLEGPDADEFDPFIKTLKDEKGTLASVLNLSDEEYNNYYKTAAAIALKETKGGNDLVIRKKSVNTPLGKVNIPIPSYVTDKAANKIEKILEKRGLGDSDAAKFLSKNVGARTGITQLNVKDFWKTPRTAQAATKIGLTPDSDPFDPSVMAKMTMIWLRELDLNTRNADVSISTPDRLNVAWNRGQGFFNRNARKKTLNLQTPDQKRFNKEYDNISILDASYNTAVPNVGTYDDPLLDVGSLSEITIVPGGYEVSDERYPRPTSPPIPQRVTSQQEAAPSQIISPVPSTKLIKRAQPNVNDNFEIPPPPTTAPWEKPYQWDPQSKKYYREWTPEEMQERIQMQQLATDRQNNPITPIESLPQRPLGQLKAGGRLKSSQQDLVDWTNQNWRTKSGKPSHETGERYLPEDAIKALSDAEYQRTSQKKRSDGGVGNVSSQPDNIADKVRKYRMRDGGSTVNAAGNYTKPDMRKRLFEDIKGSNVMGTPAGKWSARKAQLLAKRYKEQGGGYKQIGGIVETPDGFYIEEPELMQKGGRTLQSYLNPKNWGVTDYSDRKDFNTAYAEAKKSGEKEFIFNNKRYNTTYAGTPRQEVGAYGIQGAPVKNPNKSVEVNLYPIAGRYLPGHLSAGRVEFKPEPAGPYKAHNENFKWGRGDYNRSIDMRFDGNIGDDLPYANSQLGERAFNIYDADINKFDATVKNLEGKDNYNLFLNNCADNVCDAFGIPRRKGLETPANTLKKIKGKYPAIEVTGRTLNDYYNLSETIANPVTPEEAKKVLQQANNLLGLTYSPDLQNTPIAKNFIKGIQIGLYEEGYPMSSSLTEDFQMDGVFGSETKAALEDWQRKNKSGHSMKKTIADNYQKGGPIEPVKSFYNNYLNSPKYLERLTLMGHTNPRGVISDRKELLNTVGVTTDLTQSTSYKPSKHSINLGMHGSDDVTAAHEMSHVVGALGNRGDSRLSIHPSRQLNPNEREALASRNLGLDQHYKDNNAQEMKADLDAFRYMLSKDKLYDTGTQEFNKDILNKAKQKYKTNNIINRLFQNVKSDDSLIWLMNSIADTSNTNLTTAQFGGKTNYSIVETPDGFYIEEPELMQKGGPIANPISNDLTNQEYADLYNEGRVHTYDPNTDTYNASVLPEVEIRGSAPKSWRDFARRYNKKISDDHKGSLAQALFVAPVTAAMNAPQAAATYWASKNKALVPSEAMEIKNPYLASAVDLGADMISDPLIISGLARAGIKGGFKLGKYAIKNAASFKNKTKKDLDLEKLRRSYSTERFSEPEDVIDLTHLNIFDPIDYHAFLQNYNFQQVSPTLRKLTNKSGLTKDEVIAKASSKDKDVISKMSEAEFKETVLKPTGEIVPYYQGSLDQKFTGKNNVFNLSSQEYADKFNSRLDLLNDIISKNNKSGVEYRVKELMPSGRLTFYTPPGQKLKNVNIPEGESTWGVRLNPGQWQGDVEDIASTEYLRSIPGLEMSNTSTGVFADYIPRKGTGAYQSINDYLKQLNLGRVKPGFNSQTEFSRGAWENFIKSGRGVGFYNNPKTVYATMRNLFPYVGIGGAGALGANQLSQEPESYQYGGTFNYSIEETPEGYFINETSN